MLFIKLKFIWALYSQTDINNILKGLNEIDPSNTNKNRLILESICWGPRFITHPTFKDEYNAQLGDVHPSIIQYMFGNYMREHIKKIQKSEINNFRYLLNKFICLRKQWNVIIGNDNMNFDLRKIENSTSVVGRYKDSSKFLDILLSDLKDNGPDSYVSCNTIRKDIDCVEDTITISLNGISHKCVKMFGVWRWINDDNDIERGLNILEKLFNECTNDSESGNESNESVASFYYSFVSLSPLIRGSSCIADMFRFYLNDCKMFPVKKEILSLDTYALSTHPIKFIKEWDNLFDTI